MNLAQIVQSNALSFFHLSSPDLLFGFDADPATRNIIGVAASQPAARPGRRRRAPVRAADHRVAGRQAHPSRLGRARWRRRAAVRGDPRPDPVHHPRSDRRHRARARLVQVVPAPLGGRGRRRSATSARRSWASWTRTATSTTTTAGCGSWTPTGSLLADRIDPAGLPGLPGRGRRALVVPEVDLLEGARLPRGRLPGGPAGARHRGRPDGHAARRPGARRVPPPPRASARAAPSTTTTRGSSTPFTPPSGSSSCCAARTSCRPGCASFAEVNAQRGHRRLRGAARHADPSLQGRRRRHRPVGQPGHRDRPQQPGHEPERAPGRPAIRQERPAHGADAQPGRGGHPLLRPVPLLLDPRPRRDAAPSPAHRPRRRASWTSSGGDRARPSSSDTATCCAPTTGSAGTSRSGSPPTARFDGVDVLQRHQLTPELALDVSRADLVVLVDASRGSPGGHVRHRAPDPQRDAATSTWTHRMEPSTAGRAGP